MIDISIVRQLDISDDDLAICKIFGIVPTPATNDQDVSIMTAADVIAALSLAADTTDGKKKNKVAGIEGTQ